jgi:hypothetical protein
VSNYNSSKLDRSDFNIQLIRLEHNSLLRQGWSANNFGKRNINQWLKCRQMRYYTPATLASSLYGPGLVSLSEFSLLFSSFSTWLSQYYRYFIFSLSPFQGSACRLSEFTLTCLSKADIWIRKRDSIDEAKYFLEGCISKWFIHEFTKNLILATTENICFLFPFVQWQSGELWIFNLLSIPNFLNWNDMITNNQGEALADVSVLLYAMDEA